MAGILVELMLSWIILWFFDKSSLLTLGIVPTQKHLLDLIFGLLASSMIGGLGFYLVVYVSKSSLEINPKFTISIFFDSLFWMLKSVLYEELIYRGALLYIAIKKLGINKACILSAIAFGIYHWFSYGAFGHIPQMMYIFILTGFAGALFAYSFAYTSSLWLPIGLHLGWNVITSIIFSHGVVGNQMFVSKGGEKIGVIWSTAYFIYQISALAIPTYFYLRRRK